MFGLKRRAMMTAKKEPWKHENPKAKAGTSKHLTAAEKAEAKSRATKAGRPYPNMVDNMAVARTKD
jgi:hypothetical protein